VTLADEDTNSILTDNANRAIQGNVAMHVTWWQTFATSAIWWPIFKLMQVVPSGTWPICQLMQLAHLVANFATHASGAIWWPILKLMQVVPSGGHFCN